MAADYPDYPGAAGTSYVDRYLDALAKANAPKTGIVPAYTLNLQSKLSEIRARGLATGTAVPLAYGAVQLGGLEFFTHYADGVYTLGVMFCLGEIDGYDALLINGAPPVDARWDISTGKRESMSVTYYTGTTSQGVDPTIAAVQPGYADTLIFSRPEGSIGVAYAVIQYRACHYDNWPTVVAEIRGKKVWNPATSTTVYSTYPALHLGDLLRSRLYGAGYTVDDTDLETAMDANSETVGGEARRISGTVFASAMDTDAAIEILRQYAGCWIVYRGATAHLIPDRPAASAQTFDDSDILAGSMQITKQDSSQLPTVIRVSYTDTSGDEWVEREAIAKLSGVDAGTVPWRESQVSMVGVTRYSQAYREAVERLNKLWLADLACEWETFDEGLKCEAGDVVTVSHYYGLVSKELRLTDDPEQVRPGRWRLRAAEYDSAAYSDTVATAPSTADTTMPDPLDIPVGPTPTIVEENYQLQNGTYATRLAITWAGVAYPFPHAYRIRVTAGGTLVWSDELTDLRFTTGAVQEGVAYQVETRVVGALGGVGDAGLGSITAEGKSLPPPDVTGFVAFSVNGETRGSWDAVTDDVWRYELRYASTNSWSAGNLIDQIDGLRLASRDVPAGTWYVMIKAIDSVGVYSTNAASQQVVVGAGDTVRLLAAGQFGMNGTDSVNMAQIGALNQWVTTISGDTWNSLFTAAMNTYTNALYTYHSSGTSTWYSESLDAGSVVTGTWQASHSGVALSGTITAVLQTSDDNSTWTTHTELTVRASARYARVRLQALTTSTLHVTAKAYIRVDTEYREESGSGTTDGSGILSVTLSGVYTSKIRVVVNPTATAARNWTITDWVAGDPSSFKIRLFDSSGTAVTAESVDWEFRGI